MIKRTLCFSNPAYLSLKNAQMVVKLPEVETADVSELIKAEAVRTIPIEDIGVVVLDNRRITITQGLMEALLENNCAVITCVPTAFCIFLDMTTWRKRRKKQCECVKMTSCPEISR